MISQISALDGSASSAVNGYSLDEVIGGGANNTTYRGRNSQGEEVCIKTFSLLAANSWKAKELLEREKAILEQLDHPAIPKFKDYFTAGEGPREIHYLVMEYVQGQNLARLVEGNKLFTVDEAAKIGQEVLEILGYLHSYAPPVTHRDIKPANLILTSENRIKLVDFGSAQLEFAKMLGGSTMAGTPGYAPLEAMISQAVPQSDIYALGATLLHLLTRRDPHDFLDSQYRLIIPPVIKDRKLRKLLEGMSRQEVGKRHDLQKTETELALLTTKRSLAVRVKETYSNLKKTYSNLKKYLAAKPTEEPVYLSLTVLGSERDIHGLTMGLIRSKERTVAGVNAGGVLAEVDGDVRGVNAGGLGAVAGDVRGVNASGLIARADGDVRGVNASGMFALAGEVRGVNAGGVLAGVDGDVRGVNASGLIAGADNVRGVNAGGVIAGAQDVRGVNAGGAIAGADNVRGVNAGGLVAGADNVHGVNAGGLGAVAQDVHGVNAGGAIAVVVGDVRGINVSAGLTIAKKVNGLALGLVNIVVEEMNGLEVGVVNYAKDGNNLQLGALNLSGEGPWYKKNVGWPLINKNKKKDK